MGADLVCFDMNGTVVFADAKYSLDDYDVAVVQTCWYDWQGKIIKRLKSRVPKVLINVDDWIQGIGKRAKGSQKGEMWYDFTKKEIQDSHIKILRESDGILSSTPVLAEKLSQYNQVGLAPNGVDLDRYRGWRDPIRDDGVIFGWAGGVGHQDVIRDIAEPISSAISDLNAEGIKAKLCIVGQDERRSFGQPKALYLKWADKYIYPQYLSCFDVSLAPSRDDSFYRYKSQLRLYEAAALGTPTLGGELYSPEIDGFGSICRSRDDWYSSCMELGRDEDKRNSIRDYCYENIDRFTIETRVKTWESEIRRLIGSSTSSESQPYSKSSSETVKSVT
jgi:glycosyltransferase involved in cell wall biosynthesis